MKNLITILLISILSFSACQNKSTELQNPTASEETEIENINEELITQKFMGNWFEIVYPGDFTADPSEPLQVWEEISYIETDEASFISPDKEVEFFVYSPQWAGEPKEYLLAKENEEIIDTKETKESSKTITKITFKDKAGLYTREAESIKETLGDTVLHHVFGIKFKNDEVYKKYLEDYKAFKNSLVQFAD